MAGDKVYFFFVGFPKSGSTTYYYLLKSHPEIFSPEVKEFDFFMSDFNNESQKRLKDNFFQLTKTEDDYSSFFQCNNGLIKGDFTPLNIFSKDAPRNIFKYNSTAKILISLREPVSFLRSYHFQFLYNMVEDEADLLKALSLESVRRAGQKIPKHCHNPFYLYYSSVVEYKKYIQRYTDIFGFNNLKIILFDDIMNDEHSVYQDILHFLDVKNLNFIPPKPDRNPSHSLRFGWLRDLVYTPVVKKTLYTKTPRRLLPLGAKVSHMIFKKREEKPFVSKNDVDKLKAQFRPNVTELNSFLNQNGLINRDLLALWNY